MSDQNSQQLAHDNLNTLAEIMMSAIDESCSELDKSNAVRVEAESSTVVKRRRGRPPRVQGNNGAVAVQQSKKNTKADDEDVCFICFDGGSLVLCDRRGCPKAYHPACIKRDEAFFQSKAQWNCGWHQCNTCQKASYYMCYTCPYSLCKRCTKGADYVSVRGSKGFCGICLRTIMLIENPAQGSQETTRVDFDDKGSWEYLFKVYWVNLKGELSLTLDELTRANNPWKGDEVMPQKLVSSGLQAVTPKRRKIDTQPKLLNGEMTINIDKTLGQRNSKLRDEMRDTVASQRGNGALNQVDPASAILHNLGKQLMATSEPSSAHLWSTGIGNSELDRIWHYQDPSGKVQGPFSMSQLQKWNTSGHFPTDLRIWRLGERQDSSVLLTDMLHGQYNKKLPPSYSSITHSQDMKFTPPNGVTYSVSQPSSCYGVQKDSTNVSKSQQPIQYVIGLKCNNHRELARSYQGPSRDVILTSKNGYNHSAEGNNFSTEDVQKESQTFLRNKNSKSSNLGSKGNDHKDRVRNNGSESQSSSRSAVTVVIASEQQGRGGNTSRDWDSKGGNDDSPSQPQVFSPEKSEKCTPSVQMKEGPENENFQPGQIDLNGCPSNTAESQINSGHSIEKQSDSEDYSSQSSEQRRRPPYMVSPLEVWDTKPASAANLYETSEKNDQVSASSLPNPKTTPPTSEYLNDQAIGSRQPVSSIHIQDSGPTWSTTSSQERGVEQHKELTGEWSQGSHTLSKPSEDLNCSLVSGSTLRLEDMVGDHAATSTSGSDQGRHSSESHQASNPSAWQEILPDPNEFCCLVDESVSDLLAEVEAMESLNANGPGTPTSIMNCGGDLTEGSIDDCFSPGGSFSHMGIFGTSDPRKTDDLSITGDTQLTSQPPVADKPNIGYQTNVLDPSKKINGQFSHSIELDRDARNSDVSVNQLALFGVHLSPPSIGDCNASNTNTTWRLPGLEATGSKRGPLQENTNLSWLNLLKATEPLFVEPVREPHTGSS